MFNKIQNNLLLRQPLLWNIKIVPMVAVTLLLHAVFFLTGFVKGQLNFKQKGWEYNLDSDTPTIIFFSVLLSTIVFIIWLVYYFRNNAFKSFYLKSTGSLYKEWLLILIICTLNSTYTATYMFAQDMRKTSYFNIEETQRRQDIISMAALFTNTGIYSDDGSIYTEAAVAPVYDTIVKDQVQAKQKPTTLFHHSVYRFGSYGYSYYSRGKQFENRDSINDARVKNWLINNQKDSVQWLFTEFEKITKSHGLKGNITPAEWVSLVYNYPDFIDTKQVASSDGLNDTDALAYSGNPSIRPRYYVPVKEMTYNYEKIHDAMHKPFIQYETGLAYLCVAFGLSLSIFSFRVTSGRGWLIALVSVGITAMLTGLLSLAIQTGESYPIIWLLIIACLLIYYLSVAAAKTDKGFTDITLNALIWLSAWVLPIITFIILISRRYDYSRETQEKTLAYWVEHNIMGIMYANLVFILVYMYFFTASIKKWRGIAGG